MAICFNPLWINTALKRCHVLDRRLSCFNPLWINTALKRRACCQTTWLGFNPLWINTALKPTINFSVHLNVSIPYGLTLLSN